MRLTRCMIAAAGLTACAPESAADSGGSTEDGSSSAAIVSTTETSETTGGNSTTGPSSAESSSSAGFETDPFPPPPRPRPSPSCGDGTLQLDEECDDANEVDDDACSNTCVSTASILWDVELESEGLGCATTVAVAPSGDLVVGGYAFTNGYPDMDAWIARLTAEGELSWSDSWDGSGQRPGERVEAVGLDSEGSAYALATLNAQFVRSYLSKRTPDGVELWQVPVPTELGEGSYAESLTTDADGSTTVVIAHSGQPEGARLARFDADGVMAWPAVLDTGGARFGAMELHRASDGDLRLVTVQGTAFDLRPRIERRADGGSLVWNRTADPPLASEHFAAAVGPDGSTSIVAYDAFNPAQLVLRSWTAEGDGPQTSVPGFKRRMRIEEAVVAADGTLYVAGTGFDGADPQGWLLRINPSGELVWGRRHERTVNGLALTPEGDVLIVGCSEDDEAIWLRRYAG